MSLPYAPRFAYYDGKTQSSSSTSSFQSINPATATPLANIHTTTHGAIDSAIASAQQAFPAWSSRPAIERARILQKAAALLRARNDELARIETDDTGKPFSETSTVDVVTGADVLEYFANMVGGGGLNGETVQLRPNAWVYTTKNALGVCAGIGAWNYPIQIALWKSAPCLAAGNTMVYKPSEFTSLHSTVLAEIYTEAGVPPGVFNVVQGGAAVGAYLTQHASIAKVSFTGQVSTGQKVAGSAASAMKYVTMELGGKSACIILPDADLDAAADGAMMANFFSTGQVCTNGTRVFVPAALQPAFEQALLAKMQHIRAGDVHDPRTNFGPLVSKPHFDKVQAYIAHGIQHDKATLLCGGLGPPAWLRDTTTDSTHPAAYKNGYWVRPTIFTNCTDAMLIARDEIFGPVMCILPYDTISSAVQRANASPMGLAAGVFTKDLNRAHQVIARLEAGITWVNTWGESPAEMSVGGWKMSGVGVENGRRGLEAWVRGKSTLVEMGGEGGSVFAKL
ncbi:aldehyde dehydrogenase domain-containing protein [Massariosphaeria phaeospora]|uniref:aldehyde dehydrogenase (NAD(+)) n=1 Tax=Massariosphaeria phaeospora TaxID=100035 RepID=A0A7C8I6A0_9PLEO|nr:aldehyde dehydrogenase domain-containing protein [Massariosphaeria phaeospora]